MATTPLLLVRHADAGDRDLWTGDQDVRPLTAEGRRQADAVRDALAQYAPARILSSAAVRCVQTVEPLATAVGVSIEIADELHEGRTTEALALLDGRPMALSSHGDVLPELLVALAGHLDAVAARGDGFGEGAAWVLDVGDDGVVTGGRYVSPR
ncbi:MAG TPA: phosphoglycerate mutase family protein [Acidimicrobiales bacterium]|nr:phosphoglycerate mutase family protein [Acidimicrobiales bacterium]